jgi:hypothetical protein
MSSSQSVRLSNRGGGHVESVRVTVLSGGRHRLEFLGPAGAVEQIRMCDPRYVPEKAAVALGLQRLAAPDQAPTATTQAVLRVLERVVTLPTPGNLDFAIAIDWYKAPVDGVAPNSWPNTSAGDLVHRAKYWYLRSSLNREKFKECGGTLVNRLADVVGEHPLLRDVDSVAAAPGHDPELRDFGTMLASATARHFGKPFACCSGPPGFRTPAKDLDPAQRAAAIGDKFACEASMDGQSVLIVDDVYSSGTTMAETARALRKAGAARVAGICPVRTMRS